MIFHRQHTVVDVRDFFLLLLRHRPADEPPKNRVLQRLFRLQILRQLPFDRTRHSRQIRLARVVQQAPQDDRRRMTAQVRFFGACHAVLRDRIKGLGLSAAAAKQRQRMGDIEHVEILCRRMQRIDMLSRYRGDGAPVHTITPKCFFLSDPIITYIQQEVQRLFIRGKPCCLTKSKDRTDTCGACPVLGIKKGVLRRAQNAD